MLFEELDFQHTALGELMLRRRRYIGLDTELYEVKLGDDFLMSSMFTASEEVLGRQGVHHAGAGGDSAAAAGGELDIVVGGLGLGYTAAAVLESPAVRSLVVVEYLEPVISWHQKGLLPVSSALTADHRCRLVHADFFGCVFSEAGFDPQSPRRRFNAVLVDIDHTPEEWLNPDNNRFYYTEGLLSVRRHLLPGGIFGLWSNDPPDSAFRAVMATAFDAEWAEPVVFYNPLQDCEVTQTVYFGLYRGS